MHYATEQPQQFLNTQLPPLKQHSHSTHSPLVEKKRVYKDAPESKTRREPNIHPQVNAKANGDTPAMGHPWAAARNSLTAPPTGS